MLVLDFPVSGSSTSPHRVAVIGSCRVTEPATILVRRRHAMLVWEMPSLTHTVTEAFQSLSYARGDYEIPDAYQLLAFASDLKSYAGGLTPELLKSIDSFVVEICDLKQIKLDKFYFQQNYFNKNFLVPHASALLPWFREFSRGKIPSPAIIEMTIRQLKDAGVAVTEEIEAILYSCRLEQMTIDDLRRGIDSLMFDKSKEWIFVSHFLIPGERGSIMDDRHRLVEALRCVTDEARVRLFDPSVFFVGRERREILDDNGANVYEYLPQFREVVATTLAKEIAGRPGGESTSLRADSSFVRDAAESINTMLLACHAERCAVFGIEESGLHQHYKTMLDANCFVQKWHIDIAMLVTNFLPRFDRYFVTNAGLGELAFLLAKCGLATTSLQQYTKRYGALRAGFARLAVEDGDAAARSEMRNDFLPDRTNASQRSLAIAIDTTTSRSCEAEIVGKFAMFDALLVNLRLFLTVRESKEEQNEAADLIQAAGFRLVKRYPALQLAYFERRGDVA